MSTVLARDALESRLLVQPFIPTLKGAAYHFVCAPGVKDRAEVIAVRKWFQAALA